MLKPIKTETQRKAALKRIDRLMDATAPDDVAELSVLAILVEKYERDAFPIKPPSRQQTLSRGRGCEAKPSG